MTDLIFYTNPMSRGRIVRWMLEELGEPYDTQIIDYGTTMKAPAYVEINPMGKVPAIRHGDRVVTETAAICAYLADAFPAAGLAPAPAHHVARAQHAQHVRHLGPSGFMWPRNRPRSVGRVGEDLRGVPHCTMRPPSMIAMRLPILNASSRSWLTKMMVRLSLSASFQQLVLQPGADQRIERRERLVHQQDRRVGGKGAGQAHALLHAARQLAHLAVGPVRQADQLQLLGDLGARSARGMPPSSSPSPTFSRTVRQGSRPNCWNTIATRVQPHARAGSPHRHG
jgi:hypothetical protein